MGDVVPFNPLDKANLAQSIANALRSSECADLGSLDSFEGSGIYAIYYSGDFFAYEPLATANSIEMAYPIYVGKADSKGKRKGGFLSEDAKGNALYSRLRQHSTSIQQAENLSLDDFFCRYLVVDDLWISLGESLLIAEHAPVWNLLVEGFGNHNPGKGRHSGARPLWDTLHPGRPWAEKLSPNDRSAESIGKEALQYLRERFAVANT